MFAHSGGKSPLKPHDPTRKSQGGQHSKKATVGEATQQGETRRARNGAQLLNASGRPGDWQRVAESEASRRSTCLPAEANTLCCGEADRPPRPHIQPKVASRAWHLFRRGPDLTTELHPPMGGGHPLWFLEGLRCNCQGQRPGVGVVWKVARNCALTTRSWALQFCWRGGQFSSPEQVRPTSARLAPLKHRLRPNPSLEQKHIRARTRVKATPLSTTGGPRGRSPDEPPTQVDLPRRGFAGDEAVAELDPRGAHSARTPGADPPTPLRGRFPRWAPEVGERAEIASGPRRAVPRDLLRPGSGIDEGRVRLPRVSLEGHGRVEIPPLRRAARSRCARRTLASQSSDSGVHRCHRQRLPRRKCEL